MQGSSQASVTLALGPPGSWQHESCSNWGVPGSSLRFPHPCYLPSTCLGSVSSKHPLSSWVSPFFQPCPPPPTNYLSTYLPNWPFVYGAEFTGIVDGHPLPWWFNIFIHLWMGLFKILLRIVLIAPGRLLHKWGLKVLGALGWSVFYKIRWLFLRKNNKLSK